MPGTVQWKEATTVILRKPRKSDYTDPSSYRLIALLNTFGKALESDVARRLRFLSEKHALLPDIQMGARGAVSCEVAPIIYRRTIFECAGA
jgi:hypothetical protein